MPAHMMARMVDTSVALPTGTYAAGATVSHFEQRTPKQRSSSSARYGQAPHRLPNQNCPTNSSLVQSRVSDTSSRKQSSR